MSANASQGRSHPRDRKCGRLVFSLSAVRLSLAQQKATPNSSGVASRGLLLSTCRLRKIRNAHLPRGLLHEEVCWTASRVVRILIGRGRRILLRIGQAAGSIIGVKVSVHGMTGKVQASVWTEATSPTSTILAGSTFAISILTHSTVTRASILAVAAFASTIAPRCSSAGSSVTCTTVLCTGCSPAHRLSVRTLASHQWRRGRTSREAQSNCPRKQHHNCLITHKIRLPLP